MSRTLCNERLNVFNACDAYFMGTLRTPPRRPGKLALLTVALLVAVAVLIVSTYDAAWSSTKTAPKQVNSGHAGATSASLASLWPTARKLQLTEAIKARCEGTMGTWCIDFLTQVPIPAVTAPRGNQSCSLDCNKVGVCSALTGLCTCPAGWMGFNCLHPMKRYCTHKYRSYGFEVPRVKPDLEAGMRLDSIWWFPGSHCAGTCDEDIAACYCPSHTPYGRIPAPAHAPLGSPPKRQGRPMGFYCQPNKLSNGSATNWGTVDPDLLFGPEGWCMVETPKHQCDCFIDGWGGTDCQMRFESFCLNQCNGRGECLQGYCKCDPGWHGIDCAHRSAAADDSKPGREVERPWIAEHVRTPAAQDYPAKATRKRPLIYVYELPSDYSTLMLQYRWGGDSCVSRLFDWNNGTLLTEFTYTLESGLLEMLLQSEHRTLNPEEADFFYVPVFPSCLMHPVRRTADSLRDNWYGFGNMRAHAATNMMLEAHHWIKSHAPYWNRRGGRDHIWLVTHDEASCYVPSAIRPSIILSHWGRKDANHTSNTGYWEDEYSLDYIHPQWEPDGFVQKIAGHPCYDPVKDLIVPLMKMPRHFHQSPLLGGITRNRTWLAFHRGRVQHENPPYSRGIRQRLANASRDGDWPNKFRIVVGEHDQVEGDYSELLSSSEFCLVLPGDGWSARMDDATLNGCIPVIIMDNVDVSFESIIDLSLFTLRIDQADAEKLPQILQAVPHERRQEMRRNLARVWQKFTYTSYGPYARQARELQQRNAEELAAAAADQRGDGDGSAAGGNATAAALPPPASLPNTVPDLDPEADDAFGVIMGWLYSRIEATR